jgi:catechol 2,3-dioxygenase-like lactoylglutathione lyase family enzyme
MIIGLHHACISTPNLDRLKAFYCDLFRLEEVTRFGWEQGNRVTDSIVGLDDSEAEFVYLRSSNAYIELFQYTHPTPKPRDPNWRVNDYGITHTCFEVTDIHGEFDRLSAAGMRFQNEAPIDAMGMLQVAYGFDPDGNIIELIQFPDRAKRRESSSLTGAPIITVTDALL